MNFDRLSWNITGDVTLNYGSFLTTILNFLIMAFVVFSIVKMMNTVTSRFSRKKEEEEETPKTKICPYCKSEIAVEASRCPHCTSQLEDMAEETNGDLEA